MIAYLKKFALGYILSAYSAEKEEQNSSFFDNLIKLFNVYTSFQLVNEYQDYIKFTILFSLLLLLTFLITTEISIRNTRPLLNIILIIWYICEILFLQECLKYLNIYFFRALMSCIYLIIFIIQYCFNYKMLNKVQSLDVKAKEILLKNREERLDSDENNKILIINNIVFSEQLKLNGGRDDNTELNIENKEKIIKKLTKKIGKKEEKSTKKIKEKEEKSKETPEMKEQSEKMRNKIKKI